MKFELDLCNYATTSDFKNTADIDELKLDADKLHIGKLKTTPVELSKLSKYCS